MRETHTPGPWVVGPYHSELPDFAVGLSKWEDGTACGCPPIGKDDYLLLTSSNLTEANARLIAAAPDLLEALIELVDMTERLVSSETGNLPQARAAIFKATGREEA